MELVLEVVNAGQFVPGSSTIKTFTEDGVIGRSEDCDWAIPDEKRYLSSRHALISRREGAFYLTDISSNGIYLKSNGARLQAQVPLRIEDGSIYRLGNFEIRAQLRQDPELRQEVGLPQAAGSIIPDDAFLDLDPLVAIEQEGRLQDNDFSILSNQPAANRYQADYAPIDMESVPVPKLIPEPVAEARPAAPTKERLGEEFWQRFAAELGVDFAALDANACEAVALQSARLLRQCVLGLQQCLRTRSELKNELRLALTTLQQHGNNPLKHLGDSREALDALLLRQKPGQPSAEQAIARVFRDLQAHQVALLSGSRAVMRATLEHFAPEQLSLRFERDGKLSRLSGAGGRWRAFGRYHQSLRQDDEWSERLLSRDFAQAYEEQIRLIATLNSEPQG